MPSTPQSVFRGYAMIRLAVRIVRHAAICLVSVSLAGARCSAMSRPHVAVLQRHSSFCSSSTAPISRTMDGSFGKIFQPRRRVA